MRLPFSSPHRQTEPIPPPPPITTMITTSSTSSTMELELEDSSTKRIIKRLADILSGLRMQKEQLSFVSSPRSSTSYPPSVSATILGVAKHEPTSERSLEELIAIGVDAWNVLRVHDAAQDAAEEKNKKDKKNKMKKDKDDKKGVGAGAKKGKFDRYLNLAVVYVTTGLERKDIRNFGDLMLYLNEERAEYSNRIGHVCFISPPGDASPEEQLDVLETSLDNPDSPDPARRPSLKRSATATERETKKAAKKAKKAAKKKTESQIKKDFQAVRTVSTWWAGGSPKEISFSDFTDAATTAALLLIGEAWGVSVDDLLVLCQSNLRSVPLEDQFLIDEAQNRRDRHQSQNSRYNSHRNYDLRGLHAGIGGDRAICFSYPETPPQFSSDLLMSVYQPHAAPPTRFGYAVWGSSAMIRRRTVAEGPMPYKGVMILPEATVMEKHIRMLRDMARQQSFDENEKEMEESVFLTWLRSHWIHAAAPTLVAEVQNVLQTLSEAPLWLERIRFESTTGASSGRANYLLMLYHHFRHSAFLAKRMKTQIEDLLSTIPPSTTAGLQSTSWLASISDDCDFWFSECDRLCKDTGLLRRFVLEQRELSQSTRGFVLTILASIFIPLSFVATFFGMNTVEINAPESKWKLKYYFYSALPLVIITVFTPFFVPPLLRWSVRSGAKFVSRPVAKFVVISLSMVYFVVSDAICVNVFSAMNRELMSIPYSETEEDQQKRASIYNHYAIPNEKCTSLDFANTVTRIMIGILAVGFCWFEIDHRRTVNPNRKTRAWPVSVAIAHFRYREGWKRMYLYYMTSVMFIVQAFLVPSDSGVFLYLVPYVFYYFKVSRRMWAKYKDRKEERNLRRRVRDMEVNSNVE